MKNPWEKIEIPYKDVNALRANAEHPLDFFWAKDEFGRYLFVYSYSTESNVFLNNLPELKGIETISLNSSRSYSRLVLILKEKNDWQLFYALCNDLLNATISVQKSETASSIILNRLRRWQEFLKRKKFNILSEEKIKGLIGELLFLKEELIPKFGSTDAIKFWLGPKGAPQDFCVNNSAIEVKCQLGGTTDNIKISSIEQLFSQMPKLYLYVVTLGKTTEDNINAVNLPIMIDQISKILEEEDSTSINLFQDLLLEVGYDFSKKYYEYNYLFVEKHFYNVIDGFPRITPESIPIGIIRVTYNISLADCSPFELETLNLEE